MRLNNEDDILKEEFRSSVLQEIEGEENIERKEESLRRYECYKDFTKKYVMQRIADEMGVNTAIDVKNRISNISFCRKIIDKRAQVYKDGAIRIMTDSEGNKLEDIQATVDKVYRKIDANSRMKKVNKFSELQKNCSLFVMPFKDSRSQKWKYKLYPLQSYLYDVIEDEANPEMPLVIIFSYFTSRRNQSLQQKPIDQNGNVSDRSGISISYNTGSDFRLGNHVNETIADSPADEGEGQKKYVWWSHKYHFTTDAKGIITDSGDNLINPIGELPFVDFSIYQDGSYWALGGDDLVDGSILLNLLLTDLFYITRYQSFGIMYAYGKNIPENMKIGPREAIVIKMQEGDPTPSIGFATPQAALDSVMSQIEKYLALLLSTNNLEPTEITSSVSASNASSGLQEMIKKSVNTDDIEDQQQIYKDGEPKIYKIISKWHNLYLDRGQLDQEFASMGKLDENAELAVKFLKPQAYMTEKEKLEVMQLRKDLGIDTMVDTIMRDNSDLTHEEAEQRLLDILEEKIKEDMIKLKDMVVNPNPNPDINQNDVNPKDQTAQDMQMNQDMMNEDMQNESDIQSNDTNANGTKGNEE